MSTKKSVSIIGCGISGIFAALELKKAGIENIQLYDKSRGVGGRLATRRANDGKFDHGIQYIKLEEIINYEEIKKLISSQTLIKTNLENIYVGKEGMTGIAKSLSKDLIINKEFKLSQIDSKDNSLIMKFENNKKIQTDAIILSSPIKQTLEIIENSNININLNKISELEKLEYFPAIILMIRSKKEIKLKNEFYEDYFDIPISFISDNYKKNVSKEKNFYTVICAHDFSASNFEKEYEEINSSLKSYLENIFIDGYEILSNHKWRYSIPKNFYPNNDSENVGNDNFIGLCGDIFTNGRFDGAIKSGISIANKLIENEF